MHRFQYHEWISFFSFHREQQLHDDADHCAVETEIHKKIFNFKSKHYNYLFIKIKQLLTLF